MTTFGPTSDILVAAFLAISQLITPVPRDAADKAEHDIHQHNAKVCQTAEAKSDKTQDMLCKTDSEVGQILHYTPMPLEQYYNLSNEQLVDQLHLICLALQDRIFLDRADWMSGKLSSRNELSSLIAPLKKSLQPIADKVLLEGASGEFQLEVANKVLTSLCHYLVDRKAIAKAVDFTGGLTYLKKLQSELPPVDELPELPQASFVYSDDGTRIGEIYDTEFVSRHGKRYVGQIHRRRSISYTKIPKMLMESFISIEDKRFREHNGFDFESARRLRGDLDGAKQGGSTLTMQLAKNVFLAADVEKERSQGKRSLSRKIKELLLLPKIERAYSKDEIAGYYLNMVSLTPRSQGVLMASMDLFGKSDLNQLTLPEMALLAAMPKGASMLNPRVHPEAAKARRDTVLQAMADQGKISPDTATKFKAEPIQLSNLREDERPRILSRYYIGHLNNLFLEKKRQNWSDPRWTMGGLDIQTPLNLKIQNLVTSSVRNGLLKYETEHGLYKWRAWIDETTNANVSIGTQIGKGATAQQALEGLHTAHPYPETNWVLAAKVPEQRSGRTHQWTLESGAKVGVTGTDQHTFSSLHDYDVVVLQPLEKNSYRLASGSHVEGAAVMIDILTGDILGISGGFTAGSYGKYAQNNRATVAKRQIGSAIKPFIYTYALNNGVSPQKAIGESVIEFPKIPNCGFHWTPGNYEGERFGSSISMESALANSVNIAVVNLFLGLAGIPKGQTNLSKAPPDIIARITDTLYDIYDFTSEFGLYPDRQKLAKAGFKGPCLPFLLGGQETSPLRVAQAYAALGNGGIRREAVFMREVLKDDQPLVVDDTEQKRNQVMQYRYALRTGTARAPQAFGAIRGVSPVAVATVRNLMQSVVRHGTAASIKKWGDIIAGKTGTTNNSKNTWFAGFNNKVAVIVWVGYDMETENLGSGTGASVALPIFQSIMEGYYKMFPEELSDPLPARGSNIIRGRNKILERNVKC